MKSILFESDMSIYICYVSAVAGNSLRTTTGRKNRTNNELVWHVYTYGVAVDCVHKCVFVLAAQHSAVDAMEILFGKLSRHATTGNVDNRVCASIRVTVVPARIRYLGRKLVLSVGKLHNVPMLRRRREPN